MSAPVVLLGANAGDAAINTTVKIDDDSHQSAAWIGYRCVLGGDGDDDDVALNEPRPPPSNRAALIIAFRPLPGFRRTQSVCNQEPCEGPMSPLKKAVAR